MTTKKRWRPSAYSSPWATDALVDWCEQNFVVHPYVAEFFNTISNLWMIGFACFGLWQCHRYHHELRFKLSYVALVMVGLGSALFHGTLTYHMQLLDEIPMLFGSALFSFTSINPHQAYPSITWTLNLIFYPAIGTWIYVQNRDAFFFQSVYVSLVIFLTYKAIRNRAYLKAPLESSLPPASAKDLAQFRRASRSLCWRAIGTYLLASAFWMVDYVLCHSHLIPWKRAVGQPWDSLLELHAWWHLLSGYGTYCAITYFLCIRSVAFRFDPNKTRLSLRWWMGLPYVHQSQDGSKKNN